MLFLIYRQFVTKFIRKIHYSISSSIILRQHQTQSKQIVNTAAIIMSIASTLALIFTVLASVTIVAVIILLGWFLIWKAFLSKFRLVRELLGQTNPDGTPVTPEKSLDSTSTSGSQSYAKVKKIRKD